MNKEEQFTALEKAAIKWLNETDTMQFSQMELLTMFAAHSETRTILNQVSESASSKTEHPEDFCNDCGNPNVVWYAPNELWNKLCEKPEIICPKCFQDRADKAGIPTTFKVELFSDLKKVNQVSDEEI